MIDGRLREELLSATRKVGPARSYRRFFEWCGNYPFDEEAVRKAVELISPRVCDLVGCANITNVLNFARSAPAGGRPLLRIFDTAEETAALLTFYFGRVVAATRRDDQRSSAWHIAAGTELPVVGGPGKVAAAGDLEISFHRSRYEEACGSVWPLADLVLVDKTLMWAEDPLALLRILAARQGRRNHRTILLSIYHRQSLIVHSLRGSRRLGGLRRFDRASHPRDAYPGFLGTLDDILLEGAEPLFSVIHRPRLFAYPRRTGRMVHRLPECDLTEVDLSRPVYARQHGDLVLTDDARAALAAGDRRLWADRNLLLHPRRTSPHDRLFSIGVFDIIDSVITPGMLDVEKASRVVARRHYSSAHSR